LDEGISDMMMTDKQPLSGMKGSMGKMLGKPFQSTIINEMSQSNDH
jgi:hypothetical protein